MIRATDKLSGVRVCTDEIIRAELPGIVLLRLSDAHKAFVREPTDENLMALAVTAINYQTSKLLKRA